ncbi:MAG: hypothetical protein IKB45_01435 [Clostridia bacterium]|nr:hypothetical protein [Clostridia bacterium]
MFQNVKVDIIYYKTNTDFEMEFNLCGCCRMRLLTDKSPDRKTAVHALARAVSRSKVIMMVGSLFGDDGVIKLCAGAIGKDTVFADNKAYGISGDEKIEIIKGSTPLVTPEGFFGGCIIESGPQTMILLSESKNIRKSIMTSLIHPYIKELCAMELTEDVNASAHQENQTAETEETAVITEVAEEIIAPAVIEEVATPVVIEDETATSTEETVTETEVDEISEITEANDEFVTDSILQQVVNDDIEIYYEDETEVTDESAVVISDDDEENFDGLIFEVEESYYQNQNEEFEEDDLQSSDFYTEITQNIPGNEETELTMLDDTLDNFISDEDETYEGINEFEDIEDVEEYEEFLKIQRVRALNTPLAIISVILLLLIAVVCYCIFYVPAKDGIQAAEYLREIYNSLFC